MNSKFNDWKYSIEIDYLSLYIKTWFAFLDTLKNLYPEVDCTKGDAKLVNSYSTDFNKLPTNYEEILSELRKIAKDGETCLKSQKMDNYYFDHFFKIKQCYSDSFFTKKLTRSGKNHVIKFKLKKKDSKYELSLKFESDYVFFGKIPKIEKVLLLPCESFITSNKEEIIFNNEFLIKQIEDVVQEQINDKDKLSEKEINQIIEASILVMQNLRLHINEKNDILENIPFCLFDEKISQKNEDQNKRLLKIFKWFIDFNYFLRNKLIHAVINPFQPEWIIVFKHAYLILIELVEHNIKTIESNKH